MNSQMTDFALGAKCGFPSGGALAVSARATPSLKSIAPRASPVKPMPVSARNERRVMPGQRWERFAEGMGSLLVENFTQRVGLLRPRVWPEPFGANPESGHGCA